MTVLDEAIDRLTNVLQNKYLSEKTRQDIVETIKWLIEFKEKHERK